MDKAISALKSQKELLLRAKEFIENLKKDIRIDAVFVVGSRTRGNYLDTRDIDLVIISDEMKV